MSRWIRAARSSPLRAAPASPAPPRPPSASRSSSSMTFVYQRSYRGKVQAALLDWAGTTTDFGCMAPAVVFVKVFERAGVPISMEEARVPMGAHKRVHIQKITQIDAVKQRWQAKDGRPPPGAARTRACAVLVSPPL